MEDEKMKSTHAFAVLAFACVSAPALAQTSTYDSGTPVERFPGDPVQGGAMKEYRTPAERPPMSQGQMGGAQDYGYGSSYPLSGRTSSMTDTPFDASLLPPPAPAAELAEKSQNGVSWVCGGIGDQEQAYMKSLATRYDMMVTFAVKTGEYLAGPLVAITGNDGRVLLQTRCSGPLMLVDLPEGGTYRIRAQLDEYEVARTVQLKENQGQYRQVVMTWPWSVVGVQTTGPGGEFSDTAGDFGLR
jgi:hypothetical protein